MQAGHRINESVNLPADYECQFREMTNAATYRAVGDVTYYPIFEAIHHPVWFAIDMKLYRMGRPYASG